MNWSEELATPAARARTAPGPGIERRAKDGGGNAADAADARRRPPCPWVADLRQLWRHPIQRREFGAHLTNVMRGLFLEAHGYKVRVTELTGLEHSLKNEFIFAERIQRSNSAAKAEYERLVQQFGIAPSLLRSAA